MSTIDEQLKELGLGINNSFLNPTNKQKPCFVNPQSVENYRFSFAEKDDDIALNKSSYGNIKDFVLDEQGGILSCKVDARGYIGIPAKAKIIRKGAFLGSKAKAIFIPETVIKIESGAFECCSAVLLCVAADKPRGWADDWSCGLEYILDVCEKCNAANGDVSKGNYENSIPFMTRLAELDFPFAQFFLGMYCMYGRGVEKDEVRAFGLMEAAANSGEAAAQEMLGEWYDHGKGVKKDKEKAISLWRRAAKNGNVKANVCLGFCYYNGDGVEKDLKKAAELSASAAAAGNMDAKFLLGLCYYYGNGVEKNYEKAAELFESAIAAGHKDAKFWLGYCYKNGYGKEQDTEKAMELWRELARDGHADAQYSLGAAYFNREDGDRTHDIREAIFWWKKAATMGNITAQYELGIRYYFGDGEEQSYEQAVYWWKLAAKQGHVEAQLALSSCYCEGNGVQKDIGLAKYWAGLGAERGDSRAQLMLGAYYFLGDGKERDFAKSKYWYEKSAQQGDEKAQCVMGIICLYGLTGEPDVEKALYWLDLSAKQGNQAAINMLGLLYMGGEGAKAGLIDIEKGRELTKQFDPSLNVFKITEEEKGILFDGDDMRGISLQVPGGGTLACTHIATVFVDYDAYCLLIPEMFEGAVDRASVFLINEDDNTLTEVVDPVMARRVIDEYYNLVIGVDEASGIKSEIKSLKKENKKEIKKISRIIKKHDQS